MDVYQCIEGASPGGSGSLRRLYAVSPRPAWSIKRGELQSEESIPEEVRKLVESNTDKLHANSKIEYWNGRWVIA